MTPVQKKVMTTLLNGGCITFGYRVLDHNKNPVARIREKTFKGFKKLLRKSGNVYLLNKKKVRSEHGNSFINKQYKKLLNGTRSNKSEKGVQV